MKKKINVKKLIGKGKELWDQHGDTIISVVKKIQSSMPEKSSDGSDGGTEAPKKNKLNLSEVSNLVSSVSEICTEEEEIYAPNSENLAASQTADADFSKEIMVLDDNNDTETANNREDDDCFHNSMDKLSDSLSAAAETGFTNPQAVTAALCALTEVANETVKYVTEQETQQDKIRAQRDVAIAKINATTACIKEYLDRTFDERSAIFAKQFECIDAALRTGNNEMLAISLNSINSLAASSPFKNLADINQVQQALGDGKTEWDI